MLIQSIQVYMLKRRWSGLRTQFSLAEIEAVDDSTAMLGAANSDQVLSHYAC